MSQPNEKKSGSATQTPKSASMDKIKADYIDALKRVGAGTRVIEAAKTHTAQSGRKSR